MPAMHRSRQTSPISPLLEMEASFWLEDEGFEASDLDPVALANLSLPPSISVQDLSLPIELRNRAQFGVPLFHLDGRRDRDNTVIWWPFDVARAASLGIRPGIGHQDRATFSHYQRTTLENSRNWLNQNHGRGADEDFRLFDANGPRLIKLEDLHPGGGRWATGAYTTHLDRSGRVLGAKDDPIEGTATTLPLSSCHERIETPPPLPSKIFARSQSNAASDPPLQPLPQLEHLLDLLRSLRTKARDLLRSPANRRSLHTHAILRNAFRDVLVTLAQAPRPPSEDTVELVDLTALILEDCLQILTFHPDILRRDTTLPFS